MLLVKTGHKDYLGRWGQVDRVLCLFPPEPLLAQNLLGTPAAFKLKASNCSFASEHWDP